ncbi:MFS transporter [Gulosibacter chungangensis]|uniref:MFS transporter n=1 Tax=Gulosibacter chungangensis TaxID=979746 RepID=A0A7J5BBD5_9MICO|nr:MFS transporter [Gulosibacter chungangensis]KAB1643414.1 MFS transporter [Gulosibacter chungangensis]
MPETLSISASAKANIFIGAFSAVLYSVLLVAPVIATMLAADYNLSAGSVGLIASVELGCFSLATIPAYLWLRRTNIRWVSVGCIAVVIVGNVLSALAPNFETLLGLRAITALAAGSITVIILSITAKTTNPSRSYGVFLFAQLGMGAAILLLFPVLFAGRSVAAVYLTLAVLAALCLPATFCLKGYELKKAPAEASTTANSVTSRRTDIVALVAALLAVFGFYFALGGAWTFMVEIGAAGGTEIGVAATMLGVATAAGAIIALIATIVGESPRANLFIMGGYVLMGVAMLLLFGGPGLIRFVVAVFIFKLAWSWLLPFLLSTVSRVGGTQVMNSTNLMIGGGLAVGPFVAGQIIEATGGFGTMLTTAIIVLGIAAIASAVVMSRAAKPSTAAVTDPDPTAAGSDPAVAHASA